VIEFYSSSDRVLGEIFHRVIAVNSKHKVYVVIAREYGGLNPYYVEKLVRIHGGDVDNIYVTRCFRSNDVVMVLNNLLEEESKGLLTIYTPYSYVTNSLNGLREATYITGLIHRLKNMSWRIVLFNSVNGFGYYKPSGGNYHHHVVDAILRIEVKNRRWGYVEVVKHPTMGFSRKVFPLKTLIGDRGWVGQRLLLEWF